MLNKINGLIEKLNLLREFDITPEIEQEIKELEMTIQALENAWFFEENDEH